MKYPANFDWSILAKLRKTYVRKWNRKRVYTVGVHGFDTFRAWSNWLRTQYLSR